MKKKWALLLAAVMALQPLSALTVNAEVSEPDVYADVYGIEVDFSEAPIAADLGNLELLKGESEEPITVDWESAESGSTKRTISVALDTDTKYKLSFGTTEKTFQVKTLFAEDFSDTTTFADQNVSDAEPSKFENAYGTFEVSYGTNGAFIKDGKVWVTNGALSVTALDTNLDYANTTITADIQGYAKTYMGGRYGNTVTSPNVTQVSLYMLSRATADKGNASGMWLKNDGFYSGYTDEDGDFTALGTKEVADFAFGTFADLRNLDIDASTKVIANKDLAINTDTTKTTIGLRANGTIVTSFAKEVSTTETTTNTNAGMFFISANKSGVASIDNVKITTYTENVTPAISGTLSVENITYDYDGIVLSFNESIEEVGPLSRGKIEVYQDSATEPMTLTSSEIDPEDSKKLIIVPDGYTADHEYEVVVREGFGTPTLKTDAEWSRSFDLEETPITVTDAEFTLEGILLTFDTDLTDIADQADLDSIALEIDGVAVAAADRTITKDAKTLLIAPTDYTIGKTYKVTIPQGFGTPNIYLAADHVFNEEFTKIPMEVVEFTGNRGFVQVEFDAPLQPSTDVSAVEIRDANDAIVASTATITADGKLKVTIPSQTIDAVYEIYIPENFGNEVVGTSKKILQRFKQETIAYENFESNGESFGFDTSIKTSGVFTDPLDANNKMAVVSGTQIIGVPQIKLLDNYTFEFDQRIFYPIGIERTMNKILAESGYPHEASYNTATVTFNAMRFNYIDTNNYFEMSFREKAGGYQEKRGSDEYRSSASWTHLTHGDMYISPDGYVPYNYGDAFPEDAKHFKSDGTRVYTSEREQQPSTKYEVIKSGKTITINRNASPLYSYNFRYLTQTKGEIQYFSNGYSYEVWDNVRVTAFNLVDGEDIVASNLTLDSFTGELAEQATLSGKITLKNYAESQKPVRAVVVAYGEDSEMLCAYMYSLTQVAAGETQRAIAFDLDNCTGTKSVKLFLWDDLAHKTKIENYDFPTS